MSLCDTARPSTFSTLSLMHLSGYLLDWGAADLVTLNCPYSVLRQPRFPGNLLCGLSHILMPSQTSKKIAGDRSAETVWEHSV